MSDASRDGSGEGPGSGAAAGGFAELAHRDGPKIGTYVAEFATPGLGRILAAARCEFAFVDMEHSGFSFETARAVLGDLHGQGIATLLRPPSQAGHHLQRAADVGGRGIVAPMIGTADEARALVDAIKYPPLGRRGVALGIAHDDFRPAPAADALARANAKTVAVALIETAEGAANAREIAAVEGIGALWIGHLDLGASLGVPGEPEHPRFVEAVGAVMTAARERGLGVGRVVASAEEGARVHAQGCDWLCYLGDAWLLQKALREGAAEIRARIEAARPGRNVRKD